MTPVLDDSLARFIMRVALSDSSFTSNLVLEGIFTIASLQLQGMSKSAARQHRLISMLRENIMQIDKENVLRNLVATMLLYQYEVSPHTSQMNTLQILIYSRSVQQTVPRSAGVCIFAARRRSSMPRQQLLNYTKMRAQF